MPTTRDRDRTNKQQREWRAANKAKVKNHNQKYYEANKEAILAQQWLYKKTQTQTTKKRILLRRYNLTLEEFSEMEISQGFKCGICKETKPLVVDHNHNTGEVRGLLCSPCNLGLGIFQDNPDYLLAAVRYLNGIFDSTA